ncbi:MAG: 3-deoxy-manno-octulosonate cytidylyltransferase [Planctomycetota bacterium]
MSRDGPSPVAIIPARLGSQRFPRKVLADDTGMPLIVHVCHAARRLDTLERVLVATDAPEVAEAVTLAGFEAVLTGEHPNGTSRIAEVVCSLDLPDDTPVVNIQGDEPEIEPEAIRAGIEALLASQAPIATVATPFGPQEDAADPNLVKVVLDASSRALLFSRAPIPHDRDGNGTQRLRHVGLYTYRAWFLKRVADLAPTPLEQAERLEQLRFLEHGYTIAVASVASPRPGIDTPDQYRAFVARYRAARPQAPSERQQGG